MRLGEATLSVPNRTLRPARDPLVHLRSYVGMLRGRLDSFHSLSGYFLRHAGPAKRPPDTTDESRWKELVVVGHHIQQINFQSCLWSAE